MKIKNLLTARARTAGLAAAVMAGCLAATGPAVAADAIWAAGGSTIDFTDATNWQGGVAPSAGDDIIFNAGTNRVSYNALLTGFKSFSFTGGTTRIFRSPNIEKLFLGANVNSQPTILNTTNANQLLAPGEMQLIGPQTWKQATAGGSLSVGGTNIWIDELTFDAAAGSTSRISGNLRAAEPPFGNSVGHLIKTGGGTLRLDLGSTSTYQNLDIRGGTVEAESNRAFGAEAAGSVTIDNFATLRTTNSFSTAKATTLGSNGGFIEAVAGTTLTHNGNISGLGALFLTGEGTVALNGVNSRAGGTIVSNGTVAVNSDAALGANGVVPTDANGGFVIAKGIGLANGTLRSTNSFWTAKEISVGNLFGAGGSGTIETDAGQTLTHVGVLSGETLVKTGSGTLLLTGAANTHLATIVKDGNLSIDSDVHLGNALTLDGGGLIAGNITVAQNVALGSGGGTINVSGAGNTLTQTGDVGGTGAFTKTGQGTLVMGAGGTTAIGGAASVTSGTLRVEDRTAGFDGGFSNDSGGRTELESAAVSFAQGATNNGTFVSNNSVVTFGAGFVNNGTLITDPNVMNFTDWTNTDPAATIAAAGDQFNVSGNLLGNTANNTGWDTDEAILQFIAGDDDAHTMQLYGIDLGVSLGGLVDNFAWGTMALDAGQTLALEDVKNDGNDAALYLDTILLSDFATDIGDNVIDAVFGNGFNVYYNAFAGANAYLSGLTYNFAGGGQLIGYEGAGTPPPPPPPPPPSEVAEPAGLALFGMGVVGLGWVRRRRWAA